MVAFNSVTEDEKTEFIPVSPKDSTVTKIKLTNEVKLFIDRSYNKLQVYEVIFNPKIDSAKKLTVYVSLDKETVIGKGVKSHRETSQSSL
ncbi:hypothetical protein [Alkalihalobacillus pseudalcaliphilus]|uniref:hypothetical protein n=1 Tax=Alkalihalobacillus pseudalcaliphilus TaxID=79884 RepID=UPI00064DA58D|nr:hypothetical protein [Alkalihalobacillus pseudalcaliphilus]KMK75587.1 hypothetical protein AB990_09875 [Alkalihalobacillus pseudalcaliphilus]